VAGAEAIVNAAVRGFGHLDILICNAGNIQDADILQMDIGAWESVLRVHVTGAFNCAQAAVRHMAERGQGGRILVASSDAGLYGRSPAAPGVNYGTAKAAVWGLMRSLCQEVGRYGITVNAYCPAAYTRMTERLYPEEARPRLRQLLDPAFVVPLLVFLASDEAADITGHTFFIAGNSVEIAELINTPIINRPPGDGPWDPMELGQYVKVFLQGRPANVGKTQWRSVQMLKQM
jgi:NAD(P)-dependent dehydrogenase (short-subunit alcohol dehydrogenase family)